MCVKKSEKSLSALREKGGREREREREGEGEGERERERGRKGVAQEAGNHA